MKPAAALRRRFSSARSWLRAAVQRPRLETEIEAELAAHIELRTADLVRSGLSPKEAARRAHIEFGPGFKYKEDMRAALGLRWLDELTADLRFAVRLLRKSPGFTAIAVGSLALAIGANTALFSLAKSLLYDRLEIPHPDQLRLLRWTGDNNVVAHSMWGDFDAARGRGINSSVIPYPLYRELSGRVSGMLGLAAFKEDSMNATVRGTARRAVVAMVSGNYYDALEVRPQLGRAIQLSDDSVAGAGDVVVISDSLWDREFGRSPEALGQNITLNQIKLTIIGVNPRRFTGAKNVLQSPDFFVPISLEPLLRVQREKVSDLVNPGLWWVNVVGRVKPGVSEKEAQAELNAQFAAALRSFFTINAGNTLPVLQLTDGSRGLHWTDRMFRRPIFVLLALTGFVLLLACANVANLLLSRGAQRQREMSVRMALGAGRVRVARQLLTESLLLAALGGCGGLLLGYLGRNALPQLLRNSWDADSIRVSFDWGVFACTTVVILATGILFGLAPAVFAARTQVSSSLKESAQTTTRRRRGLSGKALIGMQVALSTLLVVGAGLFLRTLTALNAQDVGFNTDHLLLFDINPPAARYPAGKDIALHQQLERSFASLPGVEQVTASDMALISNNRSNNDFLPEVEANDPAKGEAEDYQDVGSDYFSTMGIPIVAGRGFSRSDTATSPKVAVINRALAERRFPKQNPIGKLFRTFEQPDGQARQTWIRIVGICGDARYSSLREEPPPQFYLPYVQQQEVGGMTYQIRTTLSPAALAPILLRTVQSVDRDLPVTDLRTQREQIDATLTIERTLAALASGFGLLALALACVGIYGVMAYSVAQRTNEIGIRLALGAEPTRVRRMILRESATLTIAGVVVGLIAALLLARLVKSMLYGITPYDPVTLSGGVALLLSVALAASWIPARRAASVQPMQALRHE